MQVHARIPGHGTRTAPGLGFGVKVWAATAVSLLWRWRELARQRRTLLTMDDRMLKDIGISRAEAEREARRPFWRDGTES
jgi:uncharacterized protein YjiS (DUF1127 family)